jgi:hypothetical protein
LWVGHYWKREGTTEDAESTEKKTERPRGGSEPEWFY